MREIGTSTFNEVNYIHGEGLTVAEKGVLADEFDAAKEFILVEFAIRCIATWSNLPLMLLVMVTRTLKHVIAGFVDALAQYEVLDPGTDATDPWTWLALDRAGPFA